MAKHKKMCEICGEEPATVPDRDRPGRPINRICSRCHGRRLAGDLQKILERKKESDLLNFRCAVANMERGINR